MFNLARFLSANQTNQRTDVNVCSIGTCIIDFSLNIFLFLLKELKYRHEVVSVEQINKKIGIK